MAPSQTPSATWLSRIAGAALGLIMLLLIHRNWGIDHDATLYFGQALAQHYPGMFSGDLFFLHGSQARYTLFPWLTGHLLSWVDPLPLFFWGGLAGLLFFAACSWYCLRALLPDRYRYWSWLGVLTLPSFYGRAIIFSYAEPFLTPRPFSEGLCLLAIGLMARNRLMGCLACVFLAGLLHPLQAIAACLVLWPWLVLHDRRWLHAVWVLLPLLAAALAGVPPLDGLFTRINPEWLASLRAINGQLFVTGWARFDYQNAGFDVLLLACACLGGGKAFGRWCLAAILGLCLGISASLILVDVLHLKLPIGLQLWRVHWLAHWFAMASLATLLLRSVDQTDIPHALLLGLTALLVWTGPEWTWLPFAVLYMFWPKLRRRLRPSVGVLLGGMFGVGMLMLAIRFGCDEWINFRLFGGRLDLYALDKRLIAFPLLALGLPLAGLAVWSRANTTMRLLLACGLLLPALALAGLRWDIRAPQRRALDAHTNSPGLFGVAIPAGSLVYWDNVGLLGTWSVLRRPDYFDPQQLSGLAFNPGTTLAANARIARMTPLLDESFACQQQTQKVPVDVSNCVIQRASMVRACAPGTPTPPDYLVLPYRQSERSVGSWTAVDPVTREIVGRYWLYSCNSVILQDSPLH